MHVKFTTNTTHDGVAPTKAVALVATGTWGSGTLSVKLYSAARGVWVTIASYTEDTTAGQEVILGRGNRYRLELTGATDASIDVDVLELRE